MIQQQIKCPIGLPAIAEALNISYHTLRKRFLRVEGISMVQYYQQKQLEGAEEMLRDPDMAIYQITDMLGFSANSNFARWFKLSTGMTPSDYRENHLLANCSK